jgi:hypothetical protein
VEADGLVVMTMKGVQKIPLQSFSKEVQERYQAELDNAKLTRARAEDAKTKAELIRLEAELYTPMRISGKVIQVLDDGVLLDGGVISVKDYEKREQMKKQIESNKELQTNEVNVAVTRDVPFGLAGPGMVRQTKKVVTTEKRTSVTTRGSVEDNINLYLKMPEVAKGLYFVVGAQSGVADDEHWSGTVYYAGKFQYKAVSGGMKTVRRYTTSKEEAKELLSGASERK